MIESITEEDKLKSNIIKETFQSKKEGIKDTTTDAIEQMSTEMNTKRVEIYNKLETLF